MTGAAEDPGASEAEPRRRLHARSVAWIVVLVVAVLAALGASYLFAPTDPTDVAPRDEVALCAAAAELRSMDVALDLSGSLTEIDDLVAALDALEEAAPHLGEDVAVVRSTFREVQLLAAGADPGDLSASAEVTALLESRGQALEAASDRMGAYLDRWCGPPVAPDGS